MHMHKFHNPTLQKDKWTDVTLTRKFFSPKFWCILVVHQNKNVNDRPA